MEIKNENVAQLVGQLVKLKAIWTSDTQAIYEGLLKIVRDSGTIDLIPILFNSDVNNNVVVNSFIKVLGQFRSRDITKADGRLKVQLYVYVKTLEILNHEAYSNSITMSGFVCKNPSLRNTPSGK